MSSKFLLFYIQLGIILWTLDGTSALMVQEASRIGNPDQRGPTNGPRYVTKSGQLICENEMRMLTCGGGSMVLKINRASYGRKFDSVCPHPSGKPKYVANTNCEIDVATQLKNSCDGKEVCTLMVNNKAFGQDPCPGTYKYLNMDYDCVAGYKKNKGVPAKLKSF